MDLVQSHRAEHWSVTRQDDLHEVVVVQLPHLGIVEVAHQLLALLLQGLFVAALP